MSALGVDLYCISDLDAAGRTVSGNEALAQALARRLQTPRGSLAAIGDDADYGLDLRDYVGEDTGTGAEAEIEAAVRAECLKDERVRDVDVTAVIRDRALTVSLRVASTAGVVRLVLAVSAVTVDLLKVV
jgi:phage baseplate assembly protein W